MPQIPTHLIDDHALPRDRTQLDATALTELRLSIASHGLRTPIEVFSLPDGYALISGFRRLSAYRALHTLTQNPGYATIAATILTLIAGFTLGSMGSHWIGGDQTDATGLPVFGWSTTGGDLRVAHFLGLHVMQALPVMALTGNRGVVLGTALFALAATVATYAMALNGLPIFAI